MEGLFLESVALLTVNESGLSCWAVLDLPSGGLRPGPGTEIDFVAGSGSAISPSTRCTTTLGLGSRSSAFELVADVLDPVRATPRLGVLLGDVRELSFLDTTPLADMLVPALDAFLGVGCLSFLSEIGDEELTICSPGSVLSRIWATS